MINTWDSYCVTPEEEGTGTKVLDTNDNFQPTLEAGDNIVIDNGQISASGTLENVQANWQTVDSEDPSYIRNKPQNLVQDADYVHIDNNFTDADVSKLEGIEAGAQVNVKPDWDAVAGSAAEILNKPTIPTVPTKVSSFTNDAGYLTQHQSLANYYTKSEIDTKIGNIETLLASI